MTFYQDKKNLMKFWKINIVSPDDSFKDEKAELGALG